MRQNDRISELAELLSLLYGARRRFRTARGTMVHRERRSLVLEAVRREAERVNRRGRGSSMQISFSRSRGGPEPPDLHEERTRFWWRPPDALREEVEGDAPGHPRTTVLSGELWWLSTPELGSISNVALTGDERLRHSTGGGERFRSLLDPSDLLALLDFEPPVVAGDRLVVRARPRDDADGPGLHLRLPAADAYELEVDRATGVVRRAAAFLDGREAAVTEIVDLALDEDLPDETFTFVPPPGEEVLPPESAREQRRFTLEEAAAAAPFTLFSIPQLPPGEWRLRVGFSAARTRPPVPPHAWLIYHRADGRGVLSLAERPAGEGGFGWPGWEPPDVERVERDGAAYEVARADPERGGRNAIQWEQEGTALQLTSDAVDVEILLDLAASLQRVRP